MILCSLPLGDAASVEAQVYQRFIELVGGPDQFIVIIPTARGAEKYDESYRFLGQLRDAGATNLLLLHTYDRTVADSERAGYSAGAMMMGSFLARGVKGLALESPTVIGDHVEGFGWLRDVVVLLGIGLDNATARVVQQDNFEIIGTGRVAIYDREPAVDPDGSFYFLGVGDSFNLLTRQAVRGRDRVALPRVIKRAQ